MEERIKYLLDRLDLEEKTIRYAEIIDSKDYDSLHDVFTEDAHIDYRASGGECGNVAEMSEFLKRVMMKVRSQHLMSNLVCKIAEDRQSADTRVMLFNPMSMGEGKSEYTYFCGLWYNMRWRMTSEGYKIVNLEQEYSYRYMRPLPERKDK